MDTNNVLHSRPKKEHASQRTGSSAESFYRALYEQAPVGYFVLDANGTIIEANRTGAAQLGLAAERLVGRRLNAFLVGASQTNFDVFLRRAFERQEPQRIELEVQQSCGEKAYMQMETVVGTSGTEKPIIWASMTDISVYKEAQLHISALNILLEQQEEARSRQLRELNAELDSFGQMVIQQLRSPLQQVYSLAKAISGLPIPVAETAECQWQQLMYQAEHLNLLLADLKDYFRLGRQRARFVSTPLERVILAAKNELYLQLSQQQVVWNQEPLPIVIGDSRILKMVFIELFDNVIKFRDADRTLEISIFSCETPSEFQIAVQDNGIGFNMRQKERIFNIFQQLHPEKQLGGLGTGLALVRRAMMRHGGRVWAEGHEGKGSVFWIALPKSITVNL